MSDGVLRYCGLQIVVDTTAAAEWDMAGYQISHADLVRMANRIAEVPHGPEDRLVGDVRVRELDGYDVVFWLSREGMLIVATICSVRPPDPENPTETILKRMGDIDMLRGALGI